MRVPQGRPRSHPNAQDGRREAFEDCSECFDKPAATSWPQESALRRDQDHPATIRSRRACEVHRASSGQSSAPHGKAWRLHLDVQRSGRQALPPSLRRARPAVHRKDAPTPRPVRDIAMRVSRQARWGQSKQTNLHRSHRDNPCNAYRCHMCKGCCVPKFRKQDYLPRPPAVLGTLGAGRASITYWSA